MAQRSGYITCDDTSWTSGRKEFINTVEPGYVEHSKETDISSIKRGFVISERLLWQNQREITTVRYSGGDSLYPIFDLDEFECIVQLSKYLSESNKTLHTESPR